METFLVIAFILFCLVFLAGFPPLVQWRLFQEDIEVKYFKRIKVTKFSFLFRGIGGKDFIGGDVKKDGVIIPMFVFQIIGYCLSIISTVSVLILFLAGYVDKYFIIIFQSSLIGAEIVLWLILTIICVILTKKRRKQVEHHKL